MWSEVPVDMAVFERLMASLSGVVKYEWGAKAHPVTRTIEGLRTLDCSGLTQLAMWKAASVVMPDGSQNQREWCVKKRLKSVKYAEVAKLKDGRLRIAFSNRHVWFVLNGKTWESYGGHGVGQRRWNNPVLLESVEACFVLTLEAEAVSGTGGSGKNAN